MRKDKTRQHKIRQDKKRQDQTSLDQSRPDQTRPDQTRPHKTTHDKTKQDNTRQHKPKTRQDNPKTRQDMTRQDKTRHDKTRQDIPKTTSRQHLDNPNSRENFQKISCNAFSAASVRFVRMSVLSVYPMPSIFSNSSIVIHCKNIQISIWRPSFRTH
jgi:hypothetical protein